MLNAKGIRIVLVQTPVTKSHYNSIENIDQITEYFSSIDGTEYYDFNRLLELDDQRDFYDEDHLNQNAVGFFNGELLDVLGL